MTHSYLSSLIAYKPRILLREGVAQLANRMQCNS